MAELTEAQLLLLDNYMYIQQSTTTGGTVGDTVDYLIANGLNKTDLSGGIDANQAMEILDKIQHDPVLRNLTVTQSINTDGVRASCFVDSSGDATVAFRGTGGSYEAWRDNLLGEYRDDTPCQMTAADFVEQCCGAYDNITVTGHSKGGNMAQYCTVMLGDKIDRCVSYDGQGFCDDFLQTYADKIADASGKISSICCKDDYVNILLNPIAGDIRYLETEPGVNPHYSWQLYDYNVRNGLVDKNGNFIGTVDQSQTMEIVADVLDAFVDKLGTLPSWLEESIVDALASDVGLVFAIITGISTGEMDWSALWDFLQDQVGAGLKLLTPLLDALEDFLNKRIAKKRHGGGHGGGGRRYGSVNSSGAGGPAIFSIQPNELKMNCISRWQSVNDGITQAMKDLADIKLLLSGLSGMELINIAALEARLFKRKLECDELEDAFREIIAKFEKAEAAIVAFS